MKSAVVILSAVVFIIIAALHVYRAYVGLPVVIGGTAVPMACSWYAAIVTGVLGVLLLIFGRK